MDEKQNENTNSLLLEALKVCYASLCTYGPHPIIEKQVDYALAKANPDGSISIPTKDEAINMAFGIAKGSEYDRRKVLRDPDDDLYYTGWMDCYDWMVKKVNTKNPNVEEIKNALDLAQCELRSAYKKLGYTGSNVLDIIDKCLADVIPSSTNSEVGIKHLLADSLPLDGDKAWDTLSVISKLVEAADILLHKNDYDGHGWEEIEICYKRGLEILQQYKR